MPHSAFMNKPDGVYIGLNSSSKIAFYGGTPATRTTLSNAAVATTVATSTTPHGFSSTQANAIIALVNELRATLVSLGLMA